MCMNDNNKTIMVGVKNSSQYLSIGFELEQHLRCDKSNKKGRRRLTHISAFKIEVASHLLSIVGVQLQPIIIKLPYTLRNNWKLKTLYLTQHICTKLQNSQDSNLPISSRFHGYWPNGSLLPLCELWWKKFPPYPPPTTYLINYLDKLRWG